MCLMCQEEAFYQAYLAYLARKQSEAGEGANADAAAFKAEAVDADGDAPIAAKEAVGDKAQPS